MSQESNISDFLNGKPSIESVAPSGLFSRLRTFLPQMEEANRNMPEEQSADAFQIVNTEKEESSDSSDDDSSDEEEEVVEKEKKKKKKKEDSGDQEKNPFTKSIEIDLDVFREQNSKVDDRDVGVQPVDTLPEAFQAKNEVQEPRKPLIEEL